MSRHYTKLRDNQVRLLLLLYKFRYVTTDLLARHLGVLPWSVNSALGTLSDRGLVGRKYDSSYKLQGKGAVYFLTSDGLDLLKDNSSVIRANLRVRYRDESLSDRFIDHHLLIFKTYLVVKQQYPDKFQMLTKYELAKDKKYPEPRPDLFLSPKGQPNSKQAYFLDIFDNTPLYAIQQRTEAYIDHADESEWQQYPAVLLVCAHGGVESRTIKYLEPKIEDIEFLITTIKALLAKDNKETAIWTNPDESELLLNL